MEVENVGPGENHSNLSVEGEPKRVKGNKRRNHRGGQKKKGKKGPEAGDKHTVTEAKEIGAVVDDAARADAGEGSNTTQDLCLYYPDHTQHGANPCEYQLQQSSTRLRQQPEKALVSLLFEISSAEQESCATGRWYTFINIT